MSGKTAKNTNDILIGIEPMVWSILSHYKGMDKTELEDIKQDVMIHIWTKILPAYDGRQCKFSSFAYRCAVNFINSKMRSRRRRAARMSGVVNRYYGQGAGAEGHARVERMLSIVTVVGGLKPIESKVLEMMLDDSRTSQNAIAKRLGYKSCSAASMILLRMRRRLREAGIDLILRRERIESGREAAIMEITTDIEAGVDENAIEDQKEKAAASEEGSAHGGLGAAGEDMEREAPDRRSKARMGEVEGADPQKQGGEGAADRHSRHPPGASKGRGDQERRVRPHGGGPRVQGRLYSGGVQHVFERGRLVEGRAS
jgi:RNA polymerase sigma factor (sigma-70 family)